MNADVEEEYKMGQSDTFFPRMEKAFFWQDLKAILNNTEYQKHTWLHIVKQYTNRDRQRVERNCIILIMREWLIPGSTGNTKKMRKRILNCSKSNLWSVSDAKDVKQGMLNTRTMKKKHLEYVIYAQTQHSL